MAQQKDLKKEEAVKNFWQKWKQPSKVTKVRISLRVKDPESGELISMSEFWKKAKPGTKLMLNGKVLAVKE